MTQAQKELSKDHTNVFTKLRQGFLKNKEADPKAPKICYLLNSYQ
jgi:hypothetical protein